MKKITKRRMLRKLYKLRESRMSEESYFFTESYTGGIGGLVLIDGDVRLRSPLDKEIIKFCNNCGKMFDTGHYQTEIEYVEHIPNTFTEIGMDCKLVCNCYDCQEKNNFNLFEIWLKAVDGKIWNISYPVKYITNYNIKNIGNKTASISDYLLVKRFLIAKRNINLVKFLDNLYNKVFRASELEFFVGEEVINNQIVRKTKNSEDGLLQLREKEKIVIKKKKLFNSGKPPLDFRRVKNLTIESAKKMVKSHIGYKDNSRFEEEGFVERYTYNRFVSLFKRKYNVLTYKGINGSDEVIGSTGFIKVQLDSALIKVLGLDILYDKEEILKNIEFIYSEYDEIYASQIYAMFETLDKSSLNTHEFLDFLDSVYLQIQHPESYARELLYSKIEDIITPYKSKLSAPLYEFGKKLMIEMEKKAFSQIEIIDLVKNKIIPIAVLRTDLVKQVIINELYGRYNSINEFKRKSESCKEVREWEEREYEKAYKITKKDRSISIHDLRIEIDKKVLKKCLKLSGWLNPLSKLDDKESITLSELVVLQKEIDKLIKADIENHSQNFSVINDFA